MGKKLTSKALAKFEATRDVWQEVLDGVREIKADGGKRTKVDANSYVVRVRLKSGLSQQSLPRRLVSRNELWSNGSKATANRPALQSSC